MLLHVTLIDSRLIQRAEKFVQRENNLLHVLKTDHRSIHSHSRSHPAYLASDLPIAIDIVQPKYPSEFLVDRSSAQHGQGDNVILQAPTDRCTPIWRLQRTYVECKRPSMVPVDGGEEVVRVFIGT